ncbi:sulfatase [Nocardioides sp. R-C-SC26]|uniref:sulfatase family protein n=1 Tax=Nocardioides sp. R-C-SC26 TaxID=2870414 RepID=UPI001E376345|nr:sulfatase [Nocardioides sp. R-C-SC26]
MTIPRPRARARAAVGVVSVVAMLVMGAFAVTSGSAAPGAAERSGPVRPNIVLVMADDLSLAELQFLPRVRSLLGTGGVTFSEATAPHPLCCPSRAQMLTGQYAQNNGVRNNRTALGGYRAFEPRTALPVWLQRAGYTTAMIGKYLNGYAEEGVGPEPGWDYWDPTIARTYQYYGFTQYADGSPTKPWEYHTDYVARRSADLVQKYAGQKAPYFLWASFVAPHGRCGERFETGKSCERPPRPSALDLLSYLTLEPPTADYPSFNEADVSDKPQRIRELPPVDVSEIRELQTRRAQALAALDRGVEQIVDAVESSGEADNTLIVFTSDNGYLLGQHRYEGKVYAYDESVRVPLLMRGAGLPRGVVDRQTAAMIDLAPTFAALAGAHPRVEVDGDPLTVRQGGQAARVDDRTLLVQAGAPQLNVFPGNWLYQGARTARYTFVQWTRPVFAELYDRRADPYELRNRADDPRYAAVRRELERRTVLLSGCSGASCRQSFGRMPQPRRGR